MVDGVTVLVDVSTVLCAFASAENEQMANITKLVRTKFFWVTIAPNS